ncbi:MAG: hypothetical protein A2X86_12385 [Bdellovibrionales bacterium GWA2_49_15]|nr:MAG: hypothetical protein A2X86_12385 [Bdellovibrionales bacterium GWA2_49_15]
MKIVFINIVLRPEAKKHSLPVGLGHILLAAKTHGFEFDLIDMASERISLDELGKMLEKKIYDVYAFGCIVTGYRYVHHISQTIKKINPNSTIICGNSVATSIPELLLKNTQVDIAVIGEGDITIVELLKALENKTSITNVRGIGFREGDKIHFTPARPVIEDLDTIGFPDWEVFNLERYLEDNAHGVGEEDTVSLPLNSARGCPHSCTFCYHVFKGERYRKYSEKAIIEEIRRINTAYKCEVITFWDELTFTNLKSVKDRVDAINGLGFNFNWGASARAGLFRKEHIEEVRALKQAGCRHISFSLENGSPEILAAMGKKISVDQFIEQALVLHEGGVPPLTSVIFGYPQETPETIQRTLDICYECNIYPSVGFLLPLPGTQIYEWAKKAGKITNEIDYLMKIGDRQDFHINLTKMADNELVETAARGLESLAKKQNLKLASVFKTGDYQKVAKP